MSEINNDQLKTIVERAEKVEGDIADSKVDLKEIFSEAKGDGFDVKIIKKILKMRKKDKDELEEEDEITKMYCKALNM